MISRQRYGYDSAGQLGRRHYNKYAQPLSPPSRAWCNATNSKKEYCQLKALHPGGHMFGPGKR